MEHFLNCHNQIFIISIWYFSKLIYLNNTRIIHLLRPPNSLRVFQDSASLDNSDVCPLQTTKSFFQSLNHANASKVITYIPFMSLK